MKIFFKEKEKLCTFFFIILSLVCLSSCGGVTPTDYTITATAGAGGSISPSETVTVTEGANQTFTITPDKCYEIANVLIDGLSAGPLTSYTFTDIQADHTISASFVVPGPRIDNTTTEVTYTTIQAAIDATSPGDTLIVCPGTYYENIVLDNKNITLRSIDPTNLSMVEATIIRGTISDSVVKFTGGDTSILKGFKITNGNASSGGGIFINYSSPVITANMITNNTGHSGGGIFIYDSSPVITGNIITENNAVGGGGGGISMNSYSSPTIQDNIIMENRTTYYGGGIYVSPSSDISPVTDRPTGWGTGRENIPTGILLVPAEGVEYNIAGNTFLGNQHGDPLGYSVGSHVYFD